MAEETRNPAVQAPTKTGFSFKEWIGIGISIAAFAITSTTTFFSSFRYDDDIRVVLKQPPWVHSIGGEEPSVIFPTEQQLVFMNAGNRAASIIKVALYIYRKDGDMPDARCEATWANFFEYDLDSFVVEPRQIAAKKTNTAKLTDNVEVIHQLFPSFKLRLFEPGQVAKLSTITVCMQFVSASPSLSTMHLQPLFSFLVEPGNTHGGKPIFHFNPTEPIVLLQTSGIGFVSAK